MRLEKRNVPFVQIANEVLYRADISLKAKGLYAYMFSKPIDWDFSADRISNECKEERKTILNTLKELKRAGLVVSKRQGNGRMLYFMDYSEQPDKLTGSLFITPQESHSTKVARWQKGTVAKGHGGDLVLVSNKDGESNIEKESNTELSPSGEIIKFIELFKPINPTVGRLYGRKNERLAAENLLKLKPLEDWVEFMTRYFFRLSNDRYCPRATTPLQLEAKLGAIIVFGQQLKSGGKMLTV